jgi:hypothetical protein
MNKNRNPINETNLKDSIVRIMSDESKELILLDALTKLYDKETALNIVNIIKSKLDGIKNDNSNSTNNRRNLSYVLPEGSLDLNKTEEFEAYKKICQDYINGMGSNLLGITGEMMATAAKNALNQYGNYVPPELALAQLTQEGGFVSDRNARPIKTKNPFNVGNVDSGSNVFKSSVMDGIQTYYNLIASSYLTSNKTPQDLLNNFVNFRGNRYASDRNYELSLKNIINKISASSNNVYNSVNKNKS